MVSFVVAISLFVLSMSETGTLSHADSPESFLVTFFEITSALNTVGLSMGGTEVLSPFGKMVIIVLMFVGRVGPLTIAAALSQRTIKGKQPLRYAEEDVVIG